MRQLDLIGRGHAELMQVALVTGKQSLAELLLHELEQLVQRERFGAYPSMLPALRAHYWLEQGQLKAASFPMGPGEEAPMMLSWS
jgi:hypothetical protein